jgi:hypothetical protein
MKRMEEWSFSSTINLGTRWGEWSASGPYRFNNGETTLGTHLIGGWLKGSTSRFWSYERETNLLPLSGIEPQLIDYLSRSLTAIWTEWWRLLSWKISRLTKPRLPAPSSCVKLAVGNTAVRERLLLSSLHIVDRMGFKPVILESTPSP